MSTSKRRTTAALDSTLSPTPSGGKIALSRNQAAALVTFCHGIVGGCFWWAFLYPDYPTDEVGPWFSTVVTAFLVVLGMTWAVSLVFLYREPLIELPEEIDDP